MCNGHTERECEDPFAKDEAGEPIEFNKFVKDCGDSSVKTELGIPGGTEPTMCRKIYQDGMSW